MDKIEVRGARTHNLKKHQPRYPARQTHCRHRAFRVWQIFTRFRHPVCRRPASLRRIALRLCATVPVADGEAGRRPHRRAVAGDFHRTEINLSTTPVRRWVPLPKFTTTCVCCTPASVNRAVRITTCRWRRKPSARWSITSSRSRKACA